MFLTAQGTTTNEADKWQSVEQVYELLLKAYNNNLLDAKNASATPIHSSSLVNDDKDVGCIPPSSAPTSVASELVKNPSEGGIDNSSHIHPIRQVINMSKIPRVIARHPGDAPRNIYDQGIFMNFMHVYIPISMTIGVYFDLFM